MYTQSHAILTTTLIRLAFGRRISGLRHLNPTLVSGALLSDLPLFVFFFYYSYLEPHSPSQLWNECFYYPEWQAAMNVFHSFPLWGGLAVAALVLKRPRAALFGLAGLLSSVEDFLVNRGVAYAHFWPLTDGRFFSPAPSWDPDPYGLAASAAEILVVLTASIWLWPRLVSRWGKALLVLAVLALMGSYGIWARVFGFL